MMSLLAGAIIGFATMFGSVFGMPGAAVTPNVMPPQHHSTTTSEHMGPGDMRMGSSTAMGMPAIVGKVLSINGTSLIVVGRGPRSTASTTYSVDASNAKIYKREVGTTTVASILTGDTVIVTGVVTDTSVVAKAILDGFAPIRTMVMNHDMQMGTSTMHMGGDMKMSSTTMRMYEEMRARVGSSTPMGMSGVVRREPPVPGQK